MGSLSYTLAETATNGAIVVARDFLPLVWYTLPHELLIGEHATVARGTIYVLGVVALCLMRMSE